MKKLIFILPVFALFVACNNNRVFSDYQEISPDDGWKKDQKISFDVNIEDTISRNDVYITVRNATEYPFRNLFLFLQTKYPDGNAITDTVDCVLANDKGEWLGDGTGDLWDNNILLKKNVVFPRKGTYTFTFEQAMRYGDQEAIDPLPLILSVGITIEKSK